MDVTASTETAPTSTPETTPETPVELPKAEPRQGARFAELARRQREMTNKQQELKAIEERLSPVQSALANAKQNPMAVLEAAGISYEDLTHYILNEGKEATPDDRVAALEKRIEEKEKAEQEARTQSEAARVESTLAEFKESISTAARADPVAYELVNSVGQYGTDLVFEVVSEYYDTNKQVLPLETALQAVEAYLEGEALKVANANKVKARLQPSPADPKEINKAPAREQGQKITLTNNLAASASSTDQKRLSDEDSKREAAKLLRWS